tara:strand:- start:251 stop:460 length:210 start_codon:yes stop_codon:yes gene_type:complete
MPTYEYKCQECGAQFEEFQSIMDEPITKCKFCEGSVQRLISKNVNIQFVGSGFYVNDKKSSKSSTSNSK